MELSPKQEADLEGAWILGWYGKDPGKPGLKVIANYMDPKGTVEQVQAWFAARRAREAMGEEVEVKEIPVKKVKKKKKVKEKTVTRV